MVLHFAFVVFVAVGSLLVLRWRRLLWPHLAVIAWAAAIVAIGFTCPLTPLEQHLRARSGGAAYEGGFIDHYIKGVPAYVCLEEPGTGDEPASIWGMTRTTFPTRLGGHRFTPSTNLQGFSANWWQYANGVTLTGPYKPAQQVNNNVGPVTITFSGSENAIMTLPGGGTTAIRRFRF